MIVSDRPRRLRAALPLTFLFLVPCLACFGRQSPGTTPAIRSSSDLVAVDVSVLDRNGKFYPGLSQRDFRVLDNGVEKPIVFFSPVNAPASVLILMETGPAVFLIHDQHLLALSSLLGGLSADDQAGLFVYADSVHELVPFTENKDSLRDSVDESQYVIGMDHLNFYDSMRAVLGRFPSGPGKKAIVALTTGLDDSPPDHWDLLERNLRAVDVVAFAVGLGGPLRGDAPVKPGKKPKKKMRNSSPESGPTPAFARADKALRSIAQITGGRAYFPQSPEDYAPAYREIAAAIRNQYVLGIAPGHDGSFHKLSVSLADSVAPPQKSKRSRNGPAFRIFCREGYLAPAP